MSDMKIDANGDLITSAMPLESLSSQTMHFVADLDASDTRRCVVETRYDALAKREITVVHYINNDTTAAEFQRAFESHADAAGLRVRVTRDKSERAAWPAGILERMRDPARAVDAGFECAILPDGRRAALHRRELIKVDAYITSDELARDIREGQGRLDDYVRALALMMYDPDFCRARHAAKREARKRRQRRKMRRGWA